MTRWVRADDFLPNFRTPQLQAHGSKRILVAHPCSIFSSAAISKKPRSSLSNSPSTHSEQRIGKKRGWR